MKSIWLALLTVTFAACASKTKAPETKAPPPTATTGKVEAKMTDVKDQVTKVTNPGVIAKAECVLKTETRSLEVRAKDKGCELAYTKGGKEKIAAESRHSVGHCQAAMKKIEDNLTKANYVCK